MPLYDLNANWCLVGRGNNQYYKDIYIDIYRALLDKALLICLYPYVPFRLDEIKVSSAVSHLLSMLGKRYLIT